MNFWYIKLKCYDTPDVCYYTGIIRSSTGTEVGMHPSKYRAYKFSDRNVAYQTARSLKLNFKCICSYEIVR